MLINVARIANMPASHHRHHHVIPARLHSGCLSILLMSALATGCSLNEHGTSTVTYYENQDGQAVRIQAFGLHLSTRAQDSGLYLGQYDSTLIYPRDQSGPDAKPSKPGRPLNESPTCDRFEPQGDCLAQVEHHLGLAIQATPHRAGLNLGARSAYRMIADTTQSQLFVINWETNNQTSHEPTTTMR